MKYIFTLFVALIATSTVTYGADPVITPVCPTCGPGGGNPVYNYTTKRMELWPQCFPYVWFTQYQAGNIADMYRNQDACRAKRLIDFGR